MIQRRISVSPDPAAPVKRGEPLNMMATRLPPSDAGFILEIMCWRNRKDPSLMRGRPAPKRPWMPSFSCSVRISFSTFFHSTPNGGVGEQIVEGLTGKAVLREAVAIEDVRGVLALDHHVRPADGVGLVVDLLTEHFQSGSRIEGKRCGRGDRRV